MRRNDGRDLEIYAYAVSILYWRCRKIQRNTGHYRGTGWFQFSIGDAKNSSTLIETWYECCKVSILYWRCVRQRQHYRRQDDQRRVSILYWRCELPTAELQRNLQHQRFNSLLEMRALSWAPALPSPSTSFNSLLEMPRC